MTISLRALREYAAILGLWPLDLNKPKDRENVDKAVSFHDPE